MKTKKDDEFSWWDEVPIEEDAHEAFDLEDILREFGDGEAPTPESGDPALRSPVPRHSTTDDGALRRHYPRTEEFPQRQIPVREEPAKPDSREVSAPSPAAKAEKGKKPEKNSGDMGSTTIRFAPVHVHTEDAEDTPTPESQPEPAPEIATPKAKGQMAGRKASAPVRHRDGAGADIPESRRKSTPEQTAPRFPDAEPKMTPPESPKPVRKKRQKKGDVPTGDKPHRTVHPSKPPKRKKAPLITAEARFRMAQEGAGGRKIRLILCMLLTVAALALGILRAQGALSDARQEILSFAESTLLILCAICACDVLVTGIARLLRPGFDLNTLVAAETILGLIHGFMSLRSGEASYCPLICLVLLFSLWGLQQKQSGIADAMDTARKTDGKLALCREPDFHQKHAAILPGSGTMEEFLTENDRTPGPQRIMEVYGLLVLLTSLVGAVLAGVKNAEVFVRNWVAIMVAGTSLCGFAVWSRPWAVLSRRLKEKGAALYGWSGAGKLAGKVIVPISDEDLFSRENLKLNGMKFYGGANPDRVLAYCVAIMEAAGSGLSSLFREQLEQRGARAYSADKLRWYESGGIGGEVMSDSVLVGSLRFMQAMGVDMPAGTKVSQAVYVAIEGELAGVFAIHYGVCRGSAEAMGTLSGCHGIMPTITAGDFIITESFLKAKFRTEISGFHFPPLSQRAELRCREAGAESAPCVLLREYRFSAVALATAGARALRTAVCWGTIISLLGGLMGLAIMMVLTLLNARDTMTLTNLGLYMSIWAVPGLLLSGWPKNV